MMNEEFVDRRPGDLEVYRRLDAFAQLRLAPDAVVMARMRSTLVAEAARLADARSAAASQPADPVPYGRERGWSISRRRAGRMASGLLAAALTVGLAVGSVAAAQAGGPLYGTRLWVETMLLPTGAADRADAQVARLDERLAEVRASLAGGDPGATSAALNAYASILTELERQAMADAAVADRVRDDVQRHLAVLEALVGRVPPQAQGALLLALDRSDSALERLDETGTGRPDDPGSNGIGPGAPGGVNGNPGRPPQGNPPTNKPDKTAAPRPESTAKPTKAPVQTAPAKTPPAAQPSKKPSSTTVSPDPTERPRRTPAGPAGPTGTRRGS
jgi:hypothetical protein